MSIQRFETGPRMSQVVVHGNTVYLAGVVANKAKGKSTTEQTQEILSIIDGHLAKAGTDKSKLLSANIYITDMKNFAEMNAVWDELGVARQHAGARHRPGQARQRRLSRRDHGGRGEVTRSRHSSSRARQRAGSPVFANASTMDCSRLLGHDETCKLTPPWPRPSPPRSCARTASGNRSAPRRRRSRAADSSDRRRTPSAAPR